MKCIQLFGIMKANDQGNLKEYLTLIYFMIFKKDYLLFLETFVDLQHISKQVSLWVNLL